MLPRLLTVALLVIVSASATMAQNRSRSTLLDDRGGLMVPTNPAELRLVSHELWLKFQRTNQRLYNFVREDAEFRAYLHVCKRHDLNVDMRPIGELSSRYLQQILLAHYEEPEYAVLEALEKQAQADLMLDLAGDIAAFEYGFQIADLRNQIKSSGSTNQAHCTSISDTYFKKYVALLATAKRQVQ